MLSCLFMSDEAHFDLNGNINKQNCRILSASNPQILHETELHPLRVTVWCAISSRCIVGPYFFEENGHTDTVTGDRREFPNKLISRNSTFRWPPRSPDLTAPDFFLWGYCKQEVYKAKPTNLNELRQSIRETIAAIPVSTLQAVRNNFLVRCRTCINEQGGHLNSIIFKTN